MRFSESQSFHEFSVANIIQGLLWWLSGSLPAMQEPQETQF